MQNNSVGLLVKENMQFWDETPHDSITKIHLLKWCLLRVPSMLLTHQTFMTLYKISKILFCVK